MSFTLVLILTNQKTKIGVFTQYAFFHCVVFSAGDFICCWSVFNLFTGIYPDFETKETVRTCFSQVRIWFRFYWLLQWNRQMLLRQMLKHLLIVFRFQGWTNVGKVVNIIKVRWHIDRVPHCARIICGKFSWWMRIRLKWTNRRSAPNSIYSCRHVNCQVKHKQKFGQVTKAKQSNSDWKVC